MDRRRRGEPDGLGDLAHRRGVAPLRAAVADEFEDPLRALLVLFRHAWTIPNGCSHVKERPESEEMPVDTTVLVDYGTRTLWALLVVAVALLVARGVRRATMMSPSRAVLCDWTTT